MFGYLCLFQIIGVVSCKSKVCVYYISSSFHSYSDIEYCFYGCCSKYTTSPCCSASYSSYLDGISNYGYTLSTAGTIGAVVGSLFALTIFVSIISYICKRMRAQRGVQGHIISQPAVAYVTTTGGAVPTAYHQTAFQPQFRSNINIMGSTEQLNVIPPNNGITAYSPSYDNLAHDNVKESENSLNAQHS